MSDNFLSIVASYADSTTKSSELRSISFSKGKTPIIGRAESLKFINLQWLEKAREMVDNESFSEFCKKNKVPNDGASLTTFILLAVSDFVEAISPRKFNHDTLETDLSMGDPTSDNVEFVKTKIIPFISFVSVE